ncbi:hypothetical protein [Ekhidna sp.]|uniref:hypothetical protein n=1 Tax=Ekhidna sp. TaxID=2608089 RepID=UPI003B58E61C
MNKKRIIVIVGIVVFGLLGWMGYSSVSSLREKEEKEEVAEELSSLFLSLGIDAAAPTGVSLLMYFNSECEHCQWEVEKLSENMDQFADVNLAMVSLEPTDSAYQFLKNHSLEQYFIETNPENIMKTFSGGVPQIFIYEGNKLKKKFKGEVKIEVLLKAIKLK